MTRAFIFDLDGTLVDSNELHVDSWDRAFRKFGKQFPRNELREQIGKGSDQYLPEFLTPDEIERFGKELDEYRSEIFQKEYLPRVRPFPKVRELFERLSDDKRRVMLATSGKAADTKYYLDLLKIESRPVRGEPWQYRFYVELQGSTEDEEVARALEELRGLTEEMRVLGCYPSARSLTNARED